MTLALRRAGQAKNEAPPIKPYKEAIEFQRKRTPMLREQFYSRAMDAARPRAFTITGLEKYASLLEAHRLGEQFADKSMSDYADRLGEIVDEHGGTVLAPERLELIHHNTMVNNNAAGAWRQMTDPEFVEDRPYFLYDGPDDGKISKICRPLHGLVVHHTDPLLRHMWHPNHHRERHGWISLAKDQVDEKDVYVSPEGYEYPVINGQRITPADGWDFHPADAFGADDASMRRALEELGEELPAKTAADYRLGKLSTLAGDDLPAIPPFLYDVQGITAAEEWTLFRELAGIPAGAERLLMLDYANDGVWINRDTLAQLGSLESEAASRLAHVEMLVAAIADPAEVWWVPLATPQGTVFVKRYIGVFGGAKGGRRAAVYVERSPGGLAWRSGWSDPEGQRRGLLTFSKVSQEVEQ